MTPSLMASHLRQCATQSSSKRRCSTLKAQGCSAPATCAPLTPDLPLPSRALAAELMIASTPMEGCSPSKIPQANSSCDGSSGNSLKRAQSMEMCWSPPFSRSRRNAALVWNDRKRTGLYSLRGGASSPVRTRTPSKAPALLKVSTSYTSPKSTNPPSDPRFSPGVRWVPSPISCGNTSALLVSFARMAAYKMASRWLPKPLHTMNLSVRFCCCTNASCAASSSRCWRSACKS
mmetsp:Transcript_25168/g.68394  ORF Transcript_25168/g.68394 Transcript_25168/m.68394 type:complete len:233 (-) Transcript_25168:512-1210(-)